MRTSSTLKSFDTPCEVSDVEIAFPANALEFMPPYDTLENYPKKFYGLFMAWFFEGVKIKGVTPRTGVDPEKAFRHLKAILGSRAPKHEHKEATICYLLDKWFEDIEWEEVKR
jgi:anti-sigma factor ChrR (cupin superfamily)